MKNRKTQNLDEVDPYSQDLSSLKSPRSLEAIRKQGFDLQDLVFIPKSEFRKTGQSRETAELRFQHREEERIQRFALVIEERRRLLDDFNESTNATKRSHSGMKREGLDAAVERMREKEKKRLQKLELKKEKELMQLATVERRNFEYRKAMEEEKEKSKERTITQTSVTPSPSVHESKVRKTHKKTEISPAEQSTESSTTHRRLASYAPTIVEDSMMKKIREIRQKLEARANRIESSKVQQSARSPIIASHEGSLHTHTTNSPSRIETEHSCDFESKELRHKELIATLESNRMKKLKEKEKIWKEKEKKVKQLEKNEEKKTEIVREKQAVAERKGIDRFHQALREKEAQILQSIAKETEKQQLSRLKRERIRHQDLLKAEKELEDLQVAERKSEEIRLSRNKEFQQTGELRNEYRRTKYAQAQRLRKIDEYQRMKTLEKIKEETEFSMRLKGAKEQELLMKQRLRKELEAEKRNMVEKFDKLTLARGPKLLKSLNGSRPISMSPSLVPKVWRESSLTPTPAPPPKTVDSSLSDDRLTDNVTLEELKNHHNQELLTLLKAESDREKVRLSSLKQAKTEIEVQVLEARFSLERAKANQRIIELSE